MHKRRQIHFRVWRQLRTPKYVFANITIGKAVETDYNIHYNSVFRLQLILRMRPIV